jgi:hypothetical protein
MTDASGEEPRVLMRRDRNRICVEGWRGGQYPRKDDRDEKWRVAINGQRVSLAALYRT